MLFGKPPSDVEVLNDIDSELINFFRVIRTRPKEFLDLFDLELVSREEFKHLANLETSKLGEIERARRFYYLIMAGWGSELNYPRFQTSITDGGHGNRLIGALKSLKERIRPVHERLKTVIIENLGWEECINRYDRAQSVFYVDPPYPANGANYYHNMKSWKEHQCLANRLAQAKAHWILSSYDRPEVREMYKSFNVVSVQAYSGMKTKKNGSSRVLNEEVLIMNFELPRAPLETQSAIELF